MKQGLIGSKLKQSYSKYIHEKINHLHYSLKEIKEDELKDLIEKKEYRFLNVTMPYKKEVLPFLDNKSPQVISTHSCNLIVNSHGKLNGFNTDYFGFLALLKHYQVDIKKKKILVLGTGGSAYTIKEALRRNGAGLVLMVTRDINKTSRYIITYEEAMKQKNAQLIVNCSPRDMYPEDQEPLIDIKSFPKLEGIVDIIYNPFRTHLVVNGLLNNIPSYGGLYMLTSQAIKSQELYYHQDYSDKYDKIYKLTRLKYVNIVLIGMTGAGKSTAGRRLAKILHKDFYDVDNEIKKTLKKSINKIFEEDGEEVFRDTETEIIRKLSSLQGAVISLGGGAIKREENMALAMRNSIIILLNRDIELIKANPNVVKTRPLISSQESIDKLYQERKDKYLKYADIVINNNDSQGKTLNLIMRELL